MVAGRRQPSRVHGRRRPLATARVYSRSAQLSPKRPGRLCQEPAGPDQSFPLPRSDYEESVMAWLAPS